MIFYVFLLVILFVIAFSIVLIYNDIYKRLITKFFFCIADVIGEVLDFDALNSFQCTRKEAARVEFTLRDIK